MFHNDQKLFHIENDFKWNFFDRDTVGRICNFAGFKEFYDIGCKNIALFETKYTNYEIFVY